MGFVAPKPPRRELERRAFHELLYCAYCRRRKRRLKGINVGEECAYCGAPERRELEEVIDAVTKLAIEPRRDVEAPPFVEIKK